VTLPSDHDDDFTELVDANLPRVDLVGKGANGLPFLVAKAAEPACEQGVLPAEFVRDLVTKTTPDAEKEQVVSLTGSPAAIAAMIHNAPIRKTEKETAVSETVTKDDGATDAEIEVSDIVADAPGGSTAESVPGSPDWEELDAATAENAIGVLGRAKAAIDWLATREETEAVTTGDGDDAYNAWDLSDACASIDYAIRTLGAFAAGEKLEAGLASELEAVTKAAAGASEPVSVLERLAPVAKAGRVLSTANEARIKTASDSLAEVLATLPAPIEDGLAVAKSEEETVTQTPAAEPAAARRQGRGGLSPELPPRSTTSRRPRRRRSPSTTPTASSSAPSPRTTSPPSPPRPPPKAETRRAATPPRAASEATEQAAAAAPAPGAQATVPAGDDTPAAPDAAGTPTAASDDDVAKATTTQTSDPETVPVAKSVAELVEEVLKDHPVVKALQDEIAELKAPARSGVFRNGVIPADLTVAKRGQDDPGAVDVAKAGELREQLANADTPADRERVSKAMQTAAAAQLATLHASRPHPAR
jgi:hypothetical protein